MQALRLRRIPKSDAARRERTIAGTCLACSAEQLRWLLQMVRASLRSKQTARFCGNGRRASGAGISSANARVTPQFDFLPASSPLVLQMAREPLLWATESRCCGAFTARSRQVVPRRGSIASRHSIRRTFSILAGLPPGGLSRLSELCVRIPNLIVHAPASVLNQLYACNRTQLLSRTTGVSDDL